LVHKDFSLFPVTGTNDQFGLQNRCSTAELIRLINDLARIPTRFATGLPPRLLADLGERRFHDLGGTGIGVREQVAVDAEGDGW